MGQPLPADPRASCPCLRTCVLHKLTLALQRRAYSPPRALVVNPLPPRHRRPSQLRRRPRRQPLALACRTTSVSTRPRTASTPRSSPSSAVRYAASTRPPPHPRASSRRLARPSTAQRPRRAPPGTGGSTSAAAIGAPSPSRSPRPTSPAASGAGATRQSARARTRTRTRSLPPSERGRRR